MHTRPSNRRPQWKALLGAAVTTALVVSGVSAASAYTYEGNNVVEVGSKPTSLTVSADGARLYSANYGSSTVSVIDTASSTVIATIPVCAAPTDLELIPNQTRLLVICGSTMSVVNTTTNASTQSLAVFTNSGIVGLDVTSSSSMVYVLSEHGLIRSIPLGSGPLVVPSTMFANLNVSANDIALSADEANLFVVEVGGTLSVVSASTGARTSVYNVFGKTYGSKEIVLSSDGTTLYITTSYGIFRVSAATGSVLSNTPTGEANVSLVRTADNSRLYSLGSIYVNSAVIWDAASMTPLATRRPNVATATGHLSDIAISPDGATLYVASESANSIIATSTTIVNATKTTISLNAGKQYFAGPTAVARLTAAPAVAGTFTLLDGVTPFAAVATANGSAAFALPNTLAVGNHTITAIFTPANTVNYTVSTSSAATLTVIPGITKTTVKPTKKNKRKLTITTSVAAGKATITVDGKKVGTAKIKKGKITFTLTKKKVKKGAHRVHVQFVPSSKSYTSSSASTVVKIKK